jgi:putative DNA primase/helicase
MVDTTTYQTPYRWFVGLLDAVGSGPKGKPVRQCPGHGDATPSLSVGKGDDDSVLLHCFAGCSASDVCTALKIPIARLFHPGSMDPAKFARVFLRGMSFPEVKHAASGRSLHHDGYLFESEHPYGDFAWKMRYRHRTTRSKEIRWESLNQHGERVPGLLGRRERDLPLYRESEVKMAIAMDELVVLVESESSVDALNKCGLYATTWAGGAGSVPTNTVQAVLEDALVLYVPDNDEAGQKSLTKVEAALPKVPVKWGEPGEDARDVLRRIGPAWFAL